MIFAKGLVQDLKSVTAGNAEEARRMGWDQVDTVAFLNGARGGTRTRMTRVEGF